MKKGNLFLGMYAAAGATGAYGGAGPLGMYAKTGATGAYGGAGATVRIRRTLLFWADPDMISKSESSAFSLAKPINQLTFSPKRLLPSTILSVYQTPLR